MMDWTTADLCDNYISELSVAQPIGLKDFGGKKSFCGEMVTIEALENNPLVRQTLSENGQGKVLIVDGGGSLKCAMMGDNIAELAVKNAWEGVIIFAAIRDSRAISELNIGVKAMGVIPIKSGKNEIGILNKTLHFAGVNFVPGEYIYADEDGIVVSKNKYY